MRHKPVLIMAGGTGGHVFPALAVARVLLDREVPVHWLGTRSGIEARVLTGQDIQFHTIDISGIRGKGLGTLLVAPLLVLRAVFQSLSLLRRLRPGVVLGMGGFASGPGSRPRPASAVRKGIPHVRQFLLAN